MPEQPPNDSASAFGQAGQTVNGPQTNIAGGVSGPVFSGEFYAPVHVGDNYITYQHVQAAPVNEAALQAATARLASLPLDTLPNPAPLPATSRMAHGRNPLFVGRSADLTQLAAILKNGASGKTAAITAMGGMGKSQLAIEFAHRYGQFFAGGIFWLSFANPAQVPAEVAQCGGAGALNIRADFGTLKFDEQLAAVMAAWQSPLPRLLIFDNCEDEALLARWRPPSGGCRVLVTSRRNAWDTTLNVEILALGVLPPEESVALLQKFRPDLTGFENLSDLATIAAELGHLPLALHLAGSYLKRYVHSLLGQPARLLAELRRPDLLNHPSLTGLGLTVSPTQHENHVARTFAISYSQLNPEDPTDALALKALAHAACFAPGEPIPRALLLQTLKLGDEHLLAAEDALLRLSGLGLLEQEENGALAIHRLVAAFVNDASIESKAFATVMDTLISEASRINKAGFPAPLRTWLAHLREVAEIAEQQGNELTGDLFNNLGHHLKMTGDYAGARAAFERALKIDEATFGPDHPNVAADINNLGSVLHATGDYASARAAFERALKIDEAAFGADHSEVATDVNNLGEVLREQGDYVGARAAFERTLKILEGQLGPDHPYVATAVNNLGQVLQAIGDYAGARAAFEHALKIDEAAFGTKHPNVATDVNNLGSLLHDTGDYARARAAFERALDIFERTLGPDHPQVATLVNNLGSLLKATGDYAGARAAYERALKIDEAAFGPDHPNVATDVNNVGSVLQDMGDYTGARTAYERALKMYEAAFGLDHPQVAILFNNLGSVLESQGDYAGARTVYARAVEILELALGADHPTTITVRDNLNSLPEE